MGSSTAPLLHATSASSAALYRPLAGDRSASEHDKGPIIPYHITSYQNKNPAHLVTRRDPHGGGVRGTDKAAASPRPREPPVKSLRCCVVGKISRLGAGTVPRYRAKVAERGEVRLRTRAARRGERDKGHLHSRSPLAVPAHHRDITAAVQAPARAARDEVVEGGV
ncbi:hypothetical protein PSPO01_08050 [Paraphaeosphaeria sporulosa]